MPQHSDICAYTNTRTHTGGGAGRPKVSPFIRYYSSLIDKQAVPVYVQVGSAQPFTCPPFLPPPSDITVLGSGGSDSGNSDKRGAGRINGGAGTGTGTGTGTDSTGSNAIGIDRDGVHGKERHMGADALTYAHSSSGKGRDRTSIAVPLIALCWARSGDKGDVCNIGVIARERRYWPVIQEQVTAVAVKQHLAHLLRGTVVRYAMPRVVGGAMNFVCTRALGGGGTMSLNIDTQGR